MLVDNRDPLKRNLFLFYLITACVRSTTEVVCLQTGVRVPLWSLILWSLVLGDTSGFWSLVLFRGSPVRFVARRGYRKGVPTTRDRPGGIPLVVTQEDFVVTAHIFVLVFNQRTVPQGLSGPQCTWIEAIPHAHSILENTPSPFTPIASHTSYLQRNDL